MLDCFLLCIHFYFVYITIFLGISFQTQYVFRFCRHALNVQIFIKMHRSDYAEKQLRIMQQIDEDHTLTQLANAWLNMAVVLTVYFTVVLTNKK